jgi:hypothetical protein
LGVAASLVAALGAGSLMAQSQAPLPLPQGPVSRDPFPTEPIGGPMPERRLSDAERMKMNQAQIKKNMIRLKEAVGELEKEFASNNTTAVLSMAAVRKTEEIEKLARDIRGLVRG